MTALISGSVPVLKPTKPISLKALHRIKLDSFFVNDYVQVGKVERLDFLVCLKTIWKKHCV